MVQNSLDIGTVLLLAFFIVFIIGLFLLRFIYALRDATQDLRYINREIRYTSGRERRHWKRKRRKIWLSILFLGQS